MRTTTHELAAFAAGLSFEDLPAEIVRLARRLTLDTLGTALAATSLGAGCASVSAVAAAAGGPAESTLIGGGRKIAAANAALANGALAHALNYDAYGHMTGHTGVACVVGPFAVAEAVAPVDGKTFVTAVVAAGEVTARIVRAMVRSGAPVSARVLGGQYFSYLGVAAGAGRVLGLTDAQMRSAFGLALMQSAGSRQVVIGGDPPAKAIYGGFPNQAGVAAALLARAGLDADVDALGGDAGVYGVATDGRFDADSLVDGLGQDYALAAVQFKPWPTSAHVAPFIEAALELARGHDVRPHDVASVVLCGRSEIVDWFEPVAERRRPSNAASAANSTMFAVAHALTYRDVGLGTFADAGLRDRRALELVDRISYSLDDAVPGGRVSIALRDGRRLDAVVDVPLGDPTRPLSDDRLVAKFRDCCTYAPFMTADDVDRLLELVDRLAELDDVSVLGQRL